MTSAIVAVLTAAFVPFAAVIGVVVGRRKVDAEARSANAGADATTVATALTLIGPMRERIQSLENDLETMRALIDRLRDRIDELELHDRIKSKGIRALSTQILDLGQAPVWPASDEEKANK